MYWYPRYVPVGVRRARANLKMRELRAQGMKVQPVELRDRNIAGSFWGQRWCEHLESFSDYANRLPRGRTYVRNGSVCHLAIEPGSVEAMVIGQELYRIVVRIRPLERPTWKAIKKACAGQIGSVLELLQGRLSDRVMDVVAHRDTGLFPQPGEIELACDCPDWATMCKHAAAVLYGVGSRLDDSPELLFRLRGVDEAELIAADMALPQGAATTDTLADGDLGDIFGIDLDPAGSPPAPNAPKPAVGAGGVAASGAPASDSLKPAAGTGPSGASGAAASDSSRPAASTGMAGASGAAVRDSSRPATSTGTAGTSGAPVSDSLKPAASTGTARASGARGSAVAADSDGANGGPAPNARKSTARAAPGPKRLRKAKKAPTPRSPDPGLPSAPPGQEDAGASAARFRPTGALIAGLRERGGFSVAEFAELLRVSAATVRRWEGAPGPLALHARSREALTVLRLEIEDRPE